jgi:glycerol-3-phosphate acyltransferase PlsY
MKILFAFLSYLVGAFPTGYILFRASEKKDIRSFGSRATGATNVLRLKGWRYAVPVALVDLLKGFCPAFLAMKIFHDIGFAALCASLAVVGHCFPVYIGFKGGKGLSAAGGAMFSLALLPALLSLVVFIITVGLTRYVSLGSILAALFFPLFLWLLQLPANLVLLSLPILLVILFRHRENMKRLIKGTERKLGQKERIAP